MLKDVASALSTRGLRVDVATWVMFMPGGRFPSRGLCSWVAVLCRGACFILRRAPALPIRLFGPMLLALVRAARLAPWRAEAP